MQWRHLRKPNSNLCSLCKVNEAKQRQLCPRCTGLLPYRDVYARRILLETMNYQRLMMVSPFYYRSPIPRVVRNFKFHEQTYHAKWMGQAMAQAFLRYRQDVLRGTLRLHPLDVLNPSCVAAIPLHPKRKVERGYNQAELLAINVAKGLALPYKAEGLFRVRETQRQSEVMNREGRRGNVERAFAVQAHVWEGQQILLIDDVSTTGASIQSAAETLLDAGALGVLALVFASDHRGYDSALHKIS